MRGPFSGVILVVSLTTTLFLLARNRHRRLTVHREITHSNLAHRDSSDSLNFGLDDRIIASGRDVYKQSGSYYNQVKVVDRSELLKHRRLSERQLIHQQYLDPRTVAQRNHPLLSSQVFKINPLIKPDGYPWQRWSPASDGSYPLNVKKFVAILAKLGRGQNELGTLHPKDYVSNNSLLTPNTIRFYGPVQTFIIRNGEVLRPKGGTGAFVSLVQHAVNKAKEYVNVEPGLKLLTEGDFPLIYDPNDYPWCGDDYVPVFRLNAIRSTQCMHSWPVLSLTYFNEASNIQLLDSPYQWEKLMNEWDQSYPWNSKIPKVVWRGRLTGYTYEDREKPRIRLIEYANPYSDIMDIQVSTRSNLIDQDDFQKYIAVLDIDGNAWSARFAKLLCYNSVVIKVEPTYVGYWDKEVDPWVHYLPVKADLSNLAERVRYAIDPSNAERVGMIIKNAQSFCKTKMTIEQYTVDILWTLLAYTELLAKSSEFYQVWRSEIDAYKMPALNMKGWSGDGPEAVFKQLSDFNG